MKKQILTISAALMLATSASAIPVKPNKRQVKQPDGTMLTVMTHGDENFHFTSTMDGKTVVKNAYGIYCYAVLNNGKLEASQQIAHDEANRGTQETTFLKSHEAHELAIRSLGKKQAAQRNSKRISRLTKRNPLIVYGAPIKKTMAGPWGGEGVGVTGKRKGLVILVNFKDKAMASIHTQEEWYNFFNQKGYTKNSNSGSVHDYFSEQSYGLLDLEFDVVGPVTVSKNRKAYGANDSKGNDIDPGGMVYEACKLVDSQVNFADYDWDGDGEVDQVYLIYAGYGEAATYDTDPDNIWQHEWQLSQMGYNLKLDGVKIDTYGCSSELNGDSGSTMDGIGTACHEFSHCMGIPDLYDTEYSGGYGMSEWDLMDSGAYGGNGYKPVGYNSYERWVSGWLQPTELKDARYVKDIKALSDTPEAYIVYNEQAPTEYYLIENRQLKGTDACLPNHGMLVIHVDYDKNAWEENTINNIKNHQRFTVVPADNKLTTGTEYGDTYPGTSGNTSLTDTSRPAATLFNANSDGRKYLGKPITEITENNGLISFTFDGGIKIDAPTELSASIDASETSFTANWNAIENSESYNLELRQKSESPSADESIRISEDFSGWGAGFKGDGTTDISGQLDEKMANKGWTGYKVYECPGTIKLGSSKATGNLTSPLITDHSSSTVTLRIKSKTYGKDEALTTASLVDTNGTEISSKTFVPNGTITSVTLDNSNETDYKVKISPKKRGYIESVSIYDGEFTDEDFSEANKASKNASSYIKKANTLQQITGVTDNCYKFMNLVKGTTYQWRVQAMSGNVVSAWTPWQTILLSSSTGIEKTVSAIDSSNEVEVFSIVGTSYGKMPYSKFLSNSSFRGSFIIRANGKSFTIVK